MRNIVIKNKTNLQINESYEGEPLMYMIQRATETKEPIESTSPIIYTERDAGVEPQYDIRTDRFEIALEAMDKVTKTAIAKRKGPVGETDGAQDSGGATTSGGATDTTGE